MASQNYAAKYTNQIDERFRIDSVTNEIINKGIKLDFTGVNTVTIYNVNVPTETNYVRTGTNRFGTLAELGTGIETFVLSQDKSFTYSIDRGNYTDSMMVQEAGSTLARTLKEVCIPNTDIYRLSVLQAYAVANSQVDPNNHTALSSSNMYTTFLSAGVVLDDLKVPAEGRVCYVPSATYALLKQDSNFIKNNDIAQELLIKGQVGDVDGVAIVKVPTSYLPANTGFILVHNTVLVAPHKFDTFRTLDQVQGVDGWVVEGRRYYDAFIPTNRGKAICVHMNT